MRCQATHRALINNRKVQRFAYVVVCGVSRGLCYKTSRSFSDGQTKRLQLIALEDPRDVTLRWEESETQAAASTHMAPC